ncbi:MAG: hypothetical protein HYU97_01245 [Deltaproteobacteria bacterium]|nr:hypothetical protein [Deltaproteobacteria bacterium]
MVIKISTHDTFKTSFLHSHKTSNGAIEQEVLFCNMLAESKSMGRETPFDKLITELYKNTRKSQVNLIRSFLQEIRTIYLMMTEVSEAFSENIKIAQRFKKLETETPPPGDIIRLTDPDLAIRVRLFYNLLVSTIVSYGEKSEFFQKIIPNYFRIKMFRNTFVAHWSEYLDVPSYGCYFNGLKKFPIPRYVRQDFKVSEVNDIFKKYELQINLGDNFIDEFDKIYQAFEEKWEKQLKTEKGSKKTDLGKLISELDQHLLIIPISDLGKFFTDLAKQSFFPSEK